MTGAQTFFSELKDLIEKHEYDKQSNVPSSILTEAAQNSIFVVTKGVTEATKFYRDAIEKLQEELVLQQNKRS